MTKTGIEKAREVADKIKKESQEERALELRRSSVAMGEASEDVRKFFQKNVDVGTDNIAGESLPILKVTEALSKNELVDGTRSLPGMFYYAPEKAQYDDVMVSILTISRGFYTMDNSSTPKPVYTTLVGGMILATGKPFVMFIRGTKLQNLWDFQKEVKTITRSSMVPMFALKVNLTSKKQENDKKQEYHIIEFSFDKNEDGKLAIVADMEFLAMLRSGVNRIEDMFSSFIERKEVNKDGSPVEAGRATPVQTTEAEVVENIIPDEVLDEAPEGANQGEVINAEDIPF